MRGPVPQESVPARARGSVAEALDGFLPSFWEVAPDRATVAGEHGHDHRLPDPGLDGLQQRLDLCRQTVAELETAVPASLREQHDVEVFAARFEAWRFAAEELRPWQRDPDGLSPLASLLFKMISSPAPDPDRRYRDVAARCASAPAWLSAFRSRLERPDRLWVDTAHRVAQATGSLLDALPTAARGAGASTEVVQEVADAARAAEAAAQDHRRWLEALTDAETCEDSWLLDDSTFSELLSRKHLGLDVDAIEALGWEQLALRTEQRDACPRPSGEAPASFDAVLAHVEATARKSRAFVIDRDLASLPEDEDLRVEPTPLFLRPVIPFAALMNSGAFERQQTSLYLVTEPASGDLSGLGPARLGGVVVHEGYPGHHLQLASANRLCSPLRARLFGGYRADGAAGFGVDLVEGWAHYCEELMLELGFGEQPGSEWILRNDQVWRAVRILVDVGMIRGRMGAEEAVGMLVEHTGMPAASAEAEVRRYTSNPGYQLCYLLGKVKLDSYREELRGLWADQYSDRRFHDLVLGAGCIPIEMMRRFERTEREDQARFEGP